MSSPKISVVVPVYNVEKYLEKCVESILSQTFSDFELILVDDGSTDSSGKICDQFAQKDSRIRVIHKENGGISSARNTCVQSAECEYISFIDSDDFVESNYLACLYDLVVKNDCDIAVGSIYNCYGDKRIPQCVKRESLVCDGKTALKYALEGVYVPGSLCSKLIRRDLMVNRDFIIGKTYEDAFYMPELLLSAEKIAITTEPLYNYWHRVNSITTEAFSDKCLHVIEAYQNTYKIVSQKCSEHIDVALFRLYWANFVVLDRMLQNDDYRNIPQYKTVLRYLKKNWFRIFRCPYFQKSRRISVLALKINVRLYRFLTVLKSRRDEVHE